MKTQNKMKFGIAMVSLMGMVPSLAGAAEWVVDPAHSSIGFDVKHLKFATVHGNFTDFSGTIDLNEKDLNQSKVNFVVKTDSINTANPKRDGHLKSADFFDTQKYPEATFTTTRIKSNGKDKYVLEGDLTVHGVKKSTKFDLVSLGRVKDPAGVEKRMYQATTDLSRKDFGLTYNATLESGGVVIGDTVKLTIDVEAASKASDKK